jgi:SAM-dependent methyltransferase
MPGTEERPTLEELTRGMVEIRHVPGSTRAAYNRIYAGPGISHPDWLWPWLLDLVAARPGMRLLDVACGEGQLLRTAGRLGLEAHGVDLSELALGRASGQPGVHVAVGNGESLPYPDGCFDRVMNLGSLEHYEDPLAGAREMARVLSPHGLVCLHVPNTFGLRWSVLFAWTHGDVHDDGQPIQRYGTRLQWTRLLEAGSLAVERVIAFDEPADRPPRARDWPGLVMRHPSRALVPASRLLPVDLASLFLFVCRKA